MYRIDINALPPVADPQCALMLAGKTAEAVLADTMLGSENVVAADRETRARKRLKTAMGPHADIAVTDDEVAQAVTRELAIAMEHTAHEYPVAGAPAWANELIGDLRTTVTNGFADVANDLRTLSVQSDNQESKRHNREVLWDRRLDNSFRPLRKAIHGIGPGLPGHLVVAPAHPNGEPYRVGDVIPSPPFPTTRGQLMTLTADQLSQLSALFNSDFGIVDEDTMDTQVLKFEQYIT